MNANVATATNQLALQSRLQYDAQQGEKMFDLKLNALATQQNYEAKLAAKDATIERMTLAQKMTDQFNILQSEIAAIRCSLSECGYYQRLRSHRWYCGCVWQQLLRHYLLIKYEGISAP